MWLLEWHSETGVSPYSASSGILQQYGKSKNRIPGLLDMCARSVTNQVAIYLSSARLAEALDSFPLALQVLEPQRDLVIAAADREHIAVPIPAHAPHFLVEGEHARCPFFLAIGR